MLDLVWYACYGSNLSRDRFLRYIKGDQGEDGCRDNSLPKKDEKIELPFQLYFAESATRKWKGGGVAFIVSSQKEKTLGRKYLITMEQFKDVMGQENRHFKGIKDDFLNKAMKLGEASIDKGWYNNLLYLKEELGFPVFTFTSSKSIGDITYNKPSIDYLKNFVIGLQETYSMSPEEVIDYLLDKPGVENNYTKEDLLSALG